MTNKSMKPLGPLVKKYDNTGAFIGYYDAEGVLFSPGGVGGATNLADLLDMDTYDLVANNPSIAALKAEADSKISTAISWLAAANTAPTLVSSTALTGTYAGVTSVVNMSPSVTTLSPAIDGITTTIQGDIWVQGIGGGLAWSVFSPPNYLGIFVSSAALGAAFPAASNPGRIASVGASAPYALWYSSGSAWAAVGGSGGTGTVTNAGGNLTANFPVFGAGTVDAKIIAGFTSDGVSKQTWGVAGTSVGALTLANATSGTVTIQPATGALGSAVWSVPAGTDTFAGLAATQALTNKTYNGNTWTAGTATLTGTAGKTLAWSNTLTFAGTDGTTMTFPGVSSKIGYLGSPTNSKSTNYTTALTDAGETIYHPTTDTTARTITIDASLAWSAGDFIVFDNDAGAGVWTIAISSGTLVMVGAAGLTGSRSLASGGRATANFTGVTGRWRISGSAELT